MVDVGIDGDVSRVGSGQPWITVRHAKAARGSADLRSGPAMDEGALERALQAGTDCVADEVATRGAKVSERCRPCAGGWVGGVPRRGRAAAERKWARRGKSR